MPLVMYDMIYHYVVIPIPGPTVLRGERRGPPGQALPPAGDRTERYRMDILSSNSFLMMQRSIDFLWSKQACILDNIANVETPGYKTKYATFEEALRSAILTSAEEKAPAAAMREAIRETPVVIHEAPESTRLDDNGVNITEQAVELARNGYQLQYVMDALSNDISTIRAAIRG